MVTNIDLNNWYNCDTCVRTSYTDDFSVHICSLNTDKPLACRYYKRDKLKNPENIQITKVSTKKAAVKEPAVTEISLW